ncbi:hemoglobin [Marininema mesophilum]|uniref:Hemoglobin n=1 Tax=Marininema mesophilum TaxID=1048340 RepID=A0A1H2WM25_9BACL|nr:globin [Marininema mesophilum]SDW81526.1 hemoglobin [Marininema mesophilum]
MSEPISLYERMGGDSTIRQIVESFYPRVQQDPLLAPLFPEDIAETIEKQRLFLTQFFGGPPLYSQIHGHPRLRARHMPFPITPHHAEAWLRNMDAALDDVGISGSLREEMWSRLTSTAVHMVNRLPEER